MQQNIIWTNDTDQIDAIIDDWKQEAAHLATAMAENPKETMADAMYGVVYGQINVYGVTTKSERHKRSYWTRTADGNGIGGRKAPVPYGS